MDLLDVILGSDERAREEARRRVHAIRHVARAGREDARSLVALVEDETVRDPSATVTFDASGKGSVTAGGHRYDGGRFATRSIGDLKASVRARSGATGSGPSLSVVEGGGPLADIGALQAMAAEGTLFQVASQFNCLEAPGPGALASVADYFDDPTQGPRAAISAFPATLVRHYAAPDGRGGSFVQGPGRQVELLADALPPDVGRVKNGYLQSTRIADVGAAAEALARNADFIRVGLQSDAQVVFGADWNGAVDGRPRIAQAFTSTLASGPYGPWGEEVAGPLEEICRQLLRAAYLGTLLAAIDLGKSRVVLTMIGGGVFHNPLPLITDSILWAVDEVADLGGGSLHVVLNRHSRASDGERHRLVDSCEETGGVYRVL